MKKNKKRTLRRILLMLALLLSCGTLGFFNPLVVTQYDYSNPKIPKSFDGYKIVQISDFHCKEFGDKEDELIKLVKECKPDMIVLTGDMIDEAHPIDNFRYLLDGISSIAQTYYVTGNHEYYTNSPFSQLYPLLEEYGVEYLDSETKTIEKDGEDILLSGLEYRNYATELSNLGMANSNKFNILLFHGSNYFDTLSCFNYDLVLSGHAHGGIIRLPFLGGLFGNDRDLFPKYDHGMFTSHHSTLICNSGLGDALIPRYNNPREIVCVTLHSK